MGPQNWRGDALADLHEILFRPSAGLFALKPRRSRPRKTGQHNSTLYSPVAGSFLDEKDPPSSNYFKRPELNKASPRSDAKGKDEAWEKVFKLLSKERSWSKRKILRLYEKSFTQPMRKGELPVHLVKAIWGPTARKQPGDDEKRDAAADNLIRKSESHVHAKYCEGAFGHYLLPDGTQIHGSYVISLRQLITELKSLMANLKAKVMHSRYKEAPPWRAPHLEEVQEFSPPEQKAMPLLYPIEGLLPVPDDEIPPDSSMPLLRTPELKRHPPYIRPKFKGKAVILSLPPLQDFSSEGARLKAYKEVPPPTFFFPEQLPLPSWKEPEEKPLPAMPVREDAKILQPPEKEVIPPYEIPIVEPRPCEASYYFIEPGRASICDGLCGRMKGMDKQGKGGPCLASPPRPLGAPSAPVSTVIPDPPFVPPAEEPLPPFIPPSLKPEPKYVGPAQSNIPEWIPPAPPDPIGYLAGQRPVFLVDCSATMTGERMNCAQNAIRYLFSKGGQVEVAATHFDIIMYSFDAWSYGALEEERQYKLTGGATRHWVKNLEFMQPTTLENMENALAWMARWRTGGTSNLKKAIEVAMQRTSADCVYLLTHGKCDRPVIIMNTLRELEKERNLTPIYPVGLEPTKSQARILKNVLADITGGQYRELDLRWQFRVYNERSRASQDMIWLTAGIEYWQRKNFQAGTPEPVDSILKRLKKQFDEERKAPQLAICRKEEEKAKLQHKILLDAVREGNRRVLEAAEESYKTTHGIILERNKKVLENAQNLWEAEVRGVRTANAQKNKLYAEWQTKALHVEAANKKAEEDARQRFMDDVKRIREKHAYNLLHGKAEHEAQVKRQKEKNELLTKNHKKQQEEMVSKAKAKNEASWKDYEDECAAITTLNTQNREKAQSGFAAACEAIIKGNQRRMKEAEDDHKWRFEAVTQENARRKSEFMARVQDLEVRKIEARKSHQERVSTMVAEHKSSIASTLTANNNLEQEAKFAWQETCKAIDEENRIVTETAYQSWKTATRAVHVENEELAKRRVELQERRDELELMNKALVKKKKEDWKEACLQLAKGYEEEVARARVGYDLYVEELRAHHAEVVEAAKISHDANVAAIQAYNETIRPYVEGSELVQKEINRIRVFLGYIVSQSNLPPDQNPKRKRTLEQSLEMLAALDNPCPPKVVIAALQTAYANDVKGRMFPETSQVGIVKEEDGTNTLRKIQHNRFSDMVPIEPKRALAHSCAGGKTVDGEGVQQKTRKATVMVAKRQQENVEAIAPIKKIKE